MNKKDIIENMKNEYLNEENMEKLKDIKEQYENKSEEDIFVEIIQLNADMKESMGEDEYKGMLGKLDSIKPFLSREQSEKLNKVLNMLNKDEES